MGGTPYCDFYNFKFTVFPDSNSFRFVQQLPVMFSPGLNLLSGSKISFGHKVPANFIALYVHDFRYFFGFYIVREFQYISVSYSFIVYGDELWQYSSVFMGLLPTFSR